MKWFGIVVSVAVILFTLFEAFETIIQPRRVTHRFRYARLYYRTNWSLWKTIARRITPMRVRLAFLSIFGPLSLLGLFASWVILLNIGFALLHWSLGTPLHGLEAPATFGTYFYFSGTTFVTLGYGDVTPLGSLGRALAVLESGLGFGFLAVVIGYLPVLFQAYSRREVTISLLDARAGSPPTAAQFLSRIARLGNVGHVDSILAEWETWSAELLESHLSFPVLSYYRSQHDNQSWLATLTLILDTCAILIASVNQEYSYRAWLTFGMARHAAVDLSLVLKTGLRAAEQDRLTVPQRDRLEQMLQAAGMQLHTSDERHARLTELFNLYEPFIESLSRRFLLPLPPVVPEHDSTADNWQRAPGMPRAPGIGSRVTGEIQQDHFG